MSHGFGIKVNDGTMPRSVWLSPKGTTRLLIHASTWGTKEEAQKRRDTLAADNAHLQFKVAAL